jgi:hypothetical protein
MNASTHRSPWLPWVEAAGIAATAILWLVLAARTWRTLNGPVDAPMVLFALAAGYAAADWMSGLAHWFCDTFFEEDTLVIGPALIQPFREHHRDPLAMTRHGFLELNGNNCLGLLLPLVAVVWLGPVAPSSGPERFAMFFLVFFVAAIAVTNRLHAWAHAPEAPSIVRWLQSHHLILSPERHAHHHRPPYAQAYCVTHGWMNPLLDRMRFFDHTARIMVRLGVPHSRTSEAKQR